MKTAKTLGFTLVELLVVMGIFAILAGAGLQIFVPMIRSFNKSSIQQEVNQNGNYALSVITQQLRNAKRIIPSGSGSIQFENQDGSISTFNLGTDSGCTSGSNQYLKLTRSSPVVIDTPVTNRDLVKGVNVTAFTVNVSSGVSPPVVGITLSLSQACNASGGLDYKASSDFTTTVSLRTY